MNRLREVIQPWNIFGAVIVALLLTALTIGILSFTQPSAGSPNPPTAAITLIPAPTETPLPVTQIILTPTPTLNIPPSPIPGTFSIGTIVQIAGTDGEGLNLRGSASLEAPIQYLGFESEVFTISEGPVEADGLVWWYIVGFHDQSRAGWAAANFLQVVQTP